MPTASGVEYPMRVAWHAVVGAVVTNAVKRSSAEVAAQQRILDIIVGQDDVAWKEIIFGLIESNQMDPWDINLSLIAERFIQELRKLQQMDFRIGGKVVLASAILLKMKAERLYDDELGALDSLIHSVQNAEDPNALMDIDGPDGPRVRPDLPRLVPRTPQPRKRKVSVYDLIEALEQALEMEARRPVRFVPRVLDRIDPPTHHIDISKIIQEVYRQIFDHYEVQKNAAGTLGFSQLVRGSTKRDHVIAFIPLLHLETARKVNLEQQEHFGPITVHLIDATAPVFAKPESHAKQRPERVSVKEPTAPEPATVVAPPVKERTTAPVQKPVPENVKQKKTTPVKKPEPKRAAKPTPVAVRPKHKPVQNARPAAKRPAPKRSAPVHRTKPKANPGKARAKAKKKQ